MIRPQDKVAPGEIQRSPNRIAWFFLHIILPLIALACGIAITIYLMKTSPEARPTKKPPTATLVEVKKVLAGNQQTAIYAMGEIIPAREIEIKPRVSGEVIEIDPEFIPGGYFHTNQTLLKIDPVDYTLTLQQLESEAAKAESDLVLEMGNQRIAEKEFSLLNEKVSPEEKALILRKPQMEKLKAARSFAESRLAQAQLDLTRTEVQAPFNSVIDSRDVNLGTRVNESTVLARLVGTDSFWLRLTLPVEQLQWLKIPLTKEQSGSSVKVFTQGNNDQLQYRTGQVIRLIASLEAQGRMAQLLVEIDDPLCRKEENRDKPRLLLGSYVQAEIEGVEISSGFSVDRANIHDNSTVWIMDNEGRLDIREVDILFKNRDQVIVKEGIADGERLVISPLSSPIEGIPLRLKDDGEKQPGADGKRQQGLKGKDAGGARRVE